MVAVPPPRASSRHRRRAARPFGAPALCCATAAATAVVGQRLVWSVSRVASRPETFTSAGSLVARYRWSVGHPRTQHLRRRVEDVGRSGAPPVVDAEILSEREGKEALAQLEKELEDQIEKASEGDQSERLRDLARLLVMAKTAEGIALTATTAEVTGAIQKAVADSLSEFVGKKDYDFDDVSQVVGRRLKDAVGDNGVAIKEATLQLDDAAKAAVAGFTGKEKYEFGDITREVDKRAQDAVNSFTGKDRYEFGDITKEVLKRSGDAVQKFTGKEEYQFGDISKTVWNNIFGGSKKDSNK